MTSRPPWQPTMEQELLLHACLATNEFTEDALREWENQTDLDDIDTGSMRLLPYLYRKIERAGVVARDHGRIKGIYARAWYLHNRRLTPAIEVLNSFPDSVPMFLLMKGAALQVLIYGDDEPTRPADDVDILIKPADIHEFMELMVDRGFGSGFLYTLEYSELIMKSLGLRNGDIELDLNWRVNGFSLDSNVETRVFERRQLIKVRGVDLYTLSLPDHFLHTLLHGSGWNDISPIRWVLDAALIAQRLTVSDWEVIVQEVIACGWGTPVLQQMEYLKNMHQVEVPQWVLDQISRSPISVAGVLMNKAVAQPTRIRRRIFRFAFAEYFYIRAYGGSPHPWLKFPGRLPKVWVKIFKEYFRKS